jgi:hypothetical protein
MQANENRWTAKSIQVAALKTSLVLIGVSALFGPAPLVWGVLAGAILALLSFSGMHRTVSGFTAGSGRRGWVPALQYVARFAVLLAVIFLLLYARWVDPIGLVVGLSSVVIALTAMAAGDLLARGRDG